MKEFELIREWAEERNLIEGSDPQTQMLKLYEEFGELTGGIAKQNHEVIVDSIGDVVVVLCVLSAQLNLPFRKGPHMTMPVEIKSIVCGIGAQIGLLSSAIRNESGNGKKEIPFITGMLQFLCIQLGIDFEHCVKTAYSEIKDRKGKMLDGVFIKEE